MSEGVNTHVIGGSGLLPCPFCGSDRLTPRVYEDIEGDPVSLVRRVVIQCQNCGIASPVGSLLEEAAQLWNKREPGFQRLDMTTFALAAQLLQTEKELKELALGIEEDFYNWPDGERWYVDAARRVLKTYRPEAGEE